MPKQMGKWIVGSYLTVVLKKNMAKVVLFINYCIAHSFINTKIKESERIGLF